MILLYCWLALASVTDSNEPYDTLVICPVDFQETLKTWVDYRRRQGYRIAIQQPSSTANGLREQLKAFASNSDLKNVVLVGDAADENVPRQNLVPTDYVAAEVNVKFGSEPEIATDHNYADLDQDGIVELNIGRIPVDSKEQLARYIRRVIAYESKKNSQQWQRRIRFVAGVGGFGKFLDQMIEQTVKRIITDLIPSAYDVSMIYGSWRSPYCPDPRRFAQTTISEFNEGSLFWVYIGHGTRKRLDRVKLPDRQYEILNEQNVARLACESGSPIAICLSCYTAAIDDGKDGLAELMFNQSKGPIAVVSSSRVSMPYAMSVLSIEFLDGYFHGKADTLGELIQTSKQALVRFDPNKSEYHTLIQSIGKAFSPLPELLKDERQEHVHLMHLLGDPLLKLHRPNPLKLTAPNSCFAGQSIKVSGTSKRTGDLKIELTYRRDRFRKRPGRRKSYVPTHQSFLQYQEAYHQAQDLVCQTVVHKIERGPFTLPLDIPEECSGACHIRGELQADQFYALGAIDIDVRSD